MQSTFVEMVAGQFLAKRRECVFPSPDVFCDHRGNVILCTIVLRSVRKPIVDSRCLKKAVSTEP